MRFTEYYHLFLIPQRYLSDKLYFQLQIVYYLPMKNLCIAISTILLFSGLFSCKTTPDTLTYDDFAYTFTTPTKPTQYSQRDLETQVQNYYNYWAGKYLKQATTNTNWYYVEGDSNGETPTKWNGINAKATSEGHGYGMIITALLDRKKEFDGLYNMYKAFPSTINNNLMSWIIPANEDTNLRSDSATDGDIDIAYSLLLANTKWGSSGIINYKFEAVRIINAIMESEISHTSWRVLLGDWNDNDYSTRPSDWIPDHFRAFKKATEDQNWENVIDTIYDIRLKISSNYSPNTGLMPDFVINKEPSPSDPNFLEGENDGNYYYNACRVPWRISCDYVLYGSVDTGKKAKVTVQTIEAWIIAKTNANPSNIKAGYNLNGEELESTGEACFTAPFIAAAVIDPEYQNFLDSGWEIIKNSKSNYFNDTLTMLTMLLISGEWQAP